MSCGSSNFAINSEFAITDRPNDGVILERRVRKQRRLSIPGTQYLRESALFATRNSAIYELSGNGANYTNVQSHHALEFQLGEEQGDLKIKGELFRTRSELAIQHPLA